MSEHKVGQVEFCISMARHILHTRSLRRQLGMRVLLVLMTFFSLGVFFIGSWLEQNIWLFTTFWFFVFLLTAILLFIGMYDALRVIKEVQAEHNQEMANDLRAIAEIIRAEEEKQKNTK